MSLKIALYTYLFSIAPILLHASHANLYYSNILLNDSKRSICHAIIEDETSYNTLDSQGWAPIHWAIWANSPETLFTILASEKSNINLRTSDGLTPLDLAVQFNYKEMTAILLGAGADPDEIRLKKETLIEHIVQPNAEQWTVLHYAAQYKKLLPNSILSLTTAAIDAQNNNGSTALHIASEKGNQKAVSVLIAYNANPNILDKKKKTPLHISLEKKHDIISYMFITTEKTDLNLQNQKGEAPLHIAITSRQPEVAFSLLKNDANPNIQTVNGDTPLHYAIASEESTIVRMLLINDANPALKNKNDKSPLYAAFLHANQLPFKILVSNANNPKEMGQTIPLKDRAEFLERCINLVLS